VLHPASPAGSLFSKSTAAAYGGRSSLPKTAPPSSEARPGNGFGVQQRTPRVSGPTIRASKRTAPPGRHLSEKDYAGSLFNGTTDKHPPANHAGPRRDRPTTPNTPGSNLRSRRRRRSDSRTRLRRRTSTPRTPRSSGPLRPGQPRILHNPQCGSGHQRPPSRHAEQPHRAAQILVSTSTAGETRGSVAATSDSPPLAQRARARSMTSWRPMMTPATADVFVHFSRSPAPATGPWRKTRRSPTPSARAQRDRRHRTSPPSDQKAADQLSTR